jgi:hypothetical protein
LVEKRRGRSGYRNKRAESRENGLDCIVLEDVGMVVKFWRWSSGGRIYGFPMVMSGRKRLAHSGLYTRARLTRGVLYLK